MILDTVISESRRNIKNSGAGGWEMTSILVTDLILVSAIPQPQVTNNSILTKLPTSVKGINGTTHSILVIDNRTVSF